jgi:Ca2+-binding RTX toxin-like protein
MGTTYIYGSENDDVLYGDSIWDTIYGGGGNDVIFCGWGHDDAWGGDGLDVIYGEDGWDNIWGGFGDDWLVGGNGDDELYGGQDNDLLIGGSGNDLLDGGSGDGDTANYGDSGSGVIVNLAKGTGQGGTAQGDTLERIENVDGSDHDDELTGDQNDNKLHGGGGNDILTGGGGADSLWGGYGNDTASYQDSWEGVVVSLMSQTGHGGDAEGDMLWVENLTGSAHADELTGDDDANTLTGLEGDDTLDGGKGIDKMLGGAGDDTYIVDHADDTAFEAVGEGAHDVVQTSVTYELEKGSEIEVLETADANGSTALDLTGNELDNTITGNAGANSLVGGMGSDVMTGNGGGDGFIWNSIAETGTNSADADVVRDFVVGLDVLILTAIDANETNGGGANNEQFEFIGDAWTHPFTAPGQINYTNDRHNTYIFLNTDGDAAAEGMIRVEGSHMVTDSWFQL